MGFDRERGQERKPRASKLAKSQFVFVVFNWLRFLGHSRMQSRQHLHCRRLCPFYTLGETPLLVFAAQIAKEKKREEQKHHGQESFRLQDVQ